MSNQKIKSINLGYKIVPFADLSDQEVAFLINHPNIFPVEYEYEKPKSNVLYAILQPETDQGYSYIDDENDVCNSLWSRNATRDLKRFNLNNVFLTKENAQKQADRNQLLADIQRFADENNDPDTLQADVYWSFKFNPSHQHRFYFSDQFISQAAISKFKDRLDILLD